MKQILMLLIVLLSLSTFSHALDLHGQHRFGITAPHHEGLPITRYLNENEITLNHGNFSLIGTINIYAAQNWQKVHTETNLYSVDQMLWEWSAEARYKLLNHVTIYTRYYEPEDRHQYREYGWARSYRWDSGFIVNW